MKTQFISLKDSPTDTSALRTVIFIDYESLFVSCKRQFFAYPDLGAILAEMKNNGKVLSIKVFGDFSKDDISAERVRIRTITSDIIDCGKDERPDRKDYTDFIMLDHIYREAIQNTSAEQFVFFTGDGHFSSVATFLKIFLDKVVGVYGVRNTLSGHLRDCATWAKVMEMEDNDNIYAVNLVQNFESGREKEIVFTFMKTVGFTQMKFGGDLLRYQNVLNRMIEEGYVNTIMTEATAERDPYKILQPAWERFDELRVRAEANEF